MGGSSGIKRNEYIMWGYMHYVVKQCFKCNKWLKESEFACRLDCNALRNQCKRCTQKQKKEYYKTNKDKMSSNNKKYYQMNKDAIKTRVHLYYKNNREDINRKMRGDYEKNKERLLLANREYRNKHKNEILIQKRKYYEKNKEIIALKNKLYFERNGENILAMNKKYHEKNKERMNALSREYQQRNIKHVTLTKKEYYKKNRNDINMKHKEYYEKNKEHTLLRNRDYQNKHKNERDEWQRKWLSKNPKKRLKHNMSNRINQSLKNKKDDRHWEDLVDYSCKELILHLEKQFNSNMTWKNYGNYWQLDHIIPLACFGYESIEHPEFKIAWDINNLQPLEGVLNDSKNDRLVLKELYTDGNVMKNLINLLNCRNTLFNCYDFVYEANNLKKLLTENGFKYLEKI